ncbi:valyl-tRNA synthetase [Lysinibacillus piscis]|uniref:Valyl-tRNA synthetase n=1 Tax=Lysinibacillus piscis TaxID=2518931 RepID=A0ABQ5NJF4_9BACI|nr:valyl-tRNA synthetase [Lysinibacillus sp. KH24]GLC88418.1 hypothetical protein LYSBPC_15450 [Lysinibacillus sp. KH24]
MRETFCFQGYGCPTEIAAVQITPQWQTKQLEDSLRLIGIYHITAHVRFDFQNMQATHYGDDSVMIDALDIQGDTGYFEYAVPLHVDLPKDAAVKDLMVKDIRPLLTNQGCQLEWAVTSVFNEQEEPFVAIPPNEPLIQDSALEQKIALRESSSQIVMRESSSWHEVPSMIWDLTEDYTPLKIRVSNNIT